MNNSNTKSQDPSDWFVEKFQLLQNSLTEEIRSQGN